MEYAEARSYLDILTAPKEIDSSDAPHRVRNRIVSGGQHLCQYCARLEWEPLGTFDSMRYNRKYQHLASKAYRHQPTWYSLLTSAKTCSLCQRIKHEVLQEYTFRQRKGSRVQTLADELVESRGALAVDASIDEEHIGIGTTWPVYLWTQAKTSDSPAVTSLPMSRIYIIVVDWLEAELTTSGKKFGSYAEFHESWKRVTRTTGLPWLDVFTLKDDPFELLGVYTAELVDSGTIENVNLISQWLGNCVSQHRDCSGRSLQPSDHNALEGPLPKRLLHISGNLNTLKVKLCDTDTKFGQYIALSYCWGKLSSPSCTTTLETIDARRGNIDMESLPKTYTDAIITTHKLGCEYLWIDSLCIIQDSLIDWQTESSRMGQYYGGALVTLAADGAEGSGIGFLDRHPGPFDPLIIDQSLQDGRRGTLLISRPIYTYDSHVQERHATGLWYTNVEQCPLATRAWAMQERVLSPRKVHFGKEQMFWECRTASLAEGGLAYVGPPQSSTTKLSLQEFSLRQAVGNIDTRDWHNILEQYTARKLTKPTDRLPAISGLARVIHRVIKQQYLAGLWIHDLHIGLAYWIDSDVPTHRPPSNTAPSWSWASLEGRIVAGGLHTCYLPGATAAFRLLDAHVDLAGLDPFGAVSGGHLTLEGQLQRAQFRDEAPRTLFALDAAGAPPEAIGDYYDDLQRRRGGEPLFCLRLSTQPATQGPSIPSPQGVLVLKRVEGRETRFERVGAGLLWKESWFEGVGMEVLTIV